MAAIVTIQTHIAPLFLHFFSLFAARTDNIRRDLGLYAPKKGADALQGSKTGGFGDSICFSEGRFCNKMKNS
jgi:hypothetical protein